MVPALTLVGRVLLSLIFILSGLSKLGATAGTVAYMESKGIPGASVLVYFVVLIEIVCGVFIASGFRARIGALVLAIFLLPTTYLFHAKEAFDPAMNVMDRMQLIQVLKNLSIIGGLLLVFANGAGKWTIGKDK